MNIPNKDDFYLLQDILKESWGYNGFIVTDWGGNNDRVKALKEGNALEMPTNKGETNKEIIDAINNHEISEEVLDCRIEELLNVIKKTLQIM